MSSLQSKHLKRSSILIAFLLITVSDGVTAPRWAGLPDSDDGGGHTNFFRSGRSRAVSCRGNVGVCLDREKNPWGGGTCCFDEYCKDTTRDPNNCGECGRTCPYGFACCDGKCVDLRNDRSHCGSCFEECRGKCSFAMCDYGG